MLYTWCPSSLRGLIIGHFSAVVYSQNNNLQEFSGTFLTSRILKENLETGSDVISFSP
jgi:hypothetical protein